MEETVVPSLKTKLVELATQNAKAMVITHLVLVCINKNCEKEHKKSIATFIVQKLTLMVEIWEVLSNSHSSPLHTGHASYTVHDVHALVEISKSW